MESIVKALQQFLTRDLLYILGGGSVILCVLSLFEIAVPTLTNPQAIFVAGIAYVVGYVIQEIISFTPILTTAHFKPNGLVRFLYRKFNNSELRVNPEIMNLTAFLNIYPDLHDRQINQIERTITLKHVGATMGANWLVSSMFLGLSAHKSVTSQSIFFASSVGFFALFLIIMSWVKGAQQMHMFCLISENRHNKSIQPTDKAADD